MQKIRDYFKDINNTLTFIFLVILCAAAFVLRARNLGYLSFWGDDGHTFAGTISILKYGFPKLPSGNILWHGILDYYLKALPVLIFGAKEFSFRIVSVLSGVGTALTVYFIGKEMANKFTGFLGASIITFSTWYIQFSREARYYSDYQFFFTLTFLFFYLGFIKDRKPYRVLAAAFMVLTPLVHGVGIMLIFLFAGLLFYKGKRFFKKEIIVPVIIVILLDALQVINQVFFWKVGRSFYVDGTGAKSLVAAYLKLPDPFYFKIINIMFPKMFYVFLAGATGLIVLAVILSINKKFKASDIYLNESIVKWGQVRWPYNLFMLYFTFVVITISLSLGNMYSQQRYIYFLMPVFVLCFSYTTYLAASGAIWVFRKIIRNKSARFYFISTVIVFAVISLLLVNGINFIEAWQLPYKKHNEKVNVMYSISNSWDIHRDAAAGGKYVAEHLQPGDVVITVDIYNSPPYTGQVDYWLWTGNLVSWAPYHEEGGKVIDDTYGVEVLRNLISFVNVLNTYTDRNVWVLTNKSLYTKEHIDPSIKQLLDEYKQHLVLIGRDDISRLYLFPKLAGGQRISLEKVFVPQSENIIKMQDKQSADFDFANISAQKYLIYGFSNVENGYGTWATGDTSIMFLDIGDKTVDDYEFAVTAKPLDNGSQRQKIELYINGNKAGDFEFTQKDSPATFTFRASEDILKTGINDLVFKYKYSTEPKALNISNDTRKLSVLFMKMLIRKD